METKLPETLIKLGYSRTKAAVLAVMMDKTAKWPMTARDLERAADLRQPELSMVVKDFKEYKWLKESDLKKQGELGRPQKVYHLGLNRARLLNYVREEVALKIDEQTALVHVLERELKDGGK
jgi:predicted transcriptional regulator